jgi:hypothetical protein
MIFLFLFGFLQLEFLIIKSKRSGSPDYPFNNIIYKLKKEAKICIMLTNVDALIPFPLF